MKILAIDTATDACSIAIVHGQEAYVRHEILPQKQGQVILDWISSLMTEAGLCIAEMDIFAYSCGPGNFTGVRLGAAVLQGFSVATQTQIVAVPSLQVIAQGIYRTRGSTDVVVIQDARMQQVYYGVYNLGPDNIMLPTQPDCLCAPDQIDSSPAIGKTLVTNAYGVYSEIAHLQAVAQFSSVVTDYYPEALDVATLASHQIISSSFNLDTLPTYLRTADAWRKIC